MAKRRTWRVDWMGPGAPEVGDIALNAKTDGLHKVVDVRVVMHRSPLLAGAVCRYRVAVVAADSGSTPTWQYRPSPRTRAT